MAGKISISFNSKTKNLEVNERRVLIVNSVERILQKVNNDERIRPYLDHYPFSSKGASISFTFLDSEGKREDDKFVAHVFITDDGSVCYSYYDLESNNLKTVHKESYEEALKIVKEQGRLETGE